MLINVDTLVEEAADTVCNTGLDIGGVIVEMMTAATPKKEELIASDQMAANVSLVVVNLATHFSLPHKFGRYVTSAIS